MLIMFLLKLVKKGKNFQFKSAQIRPIWNVHIYGARTSSDGRDEVGEYQQLFTME